MSSVIHHEPPSPNPNLCSHTGSLDRFKGGTGHQEKNKPLECGNFSPNHTAREGEGLEVEFNQVANDLNHYAL